MPLTYNPALNMLNKVKLALRVTTDAFDAELETLICAALSDLDMAGVQTWGPDMDCNKPLLALAVVTYCKLHFGEPDKVEMWDRLKASYDEQKAQLGMASGYRRGG